MRGIRDGPRNKKIAKDAAFFAGKKGGMQTRKHENDERLHAPMLIWKNGVPYNSWAHCLSNRTNSDDSSGDTEVSLFLMEESR